MELLWVLASHCPNVVLEANFRYKSDYERIRIKALQGRVTEVYCHCPKKEVMRRFAARAKQASYHPAHTFSSITPEYIEQFDRPINTGKVLMVDTTRPVDVGGLVSSVRRTWEEVAEVESRSNGNLVCKSMKSDDLQACAEIFTEVFSGSPWNENWELSSALSRLTEAADTPGFVGLKTITNNRIVAFAMGYLESFADGGHFFLKEMCVATEMQRQGIGTALLDELRSRLTEIGAKKLYLLTSRGGPAERFYAKNGFYASEKMVLMGHWLKSSR